MGNGIRFGVLHEHVQETFWNSPLDNSGHFSVFHVFRMDGKWIDLFFRIDWGYNSVTQLHAQVATNAALNIVKDVWSVQLGSLFGYYHLTQPYHLTMNWRPAAQWELAVGAMGYASNLFRPLMNPEYPYSDSFSIEAMVCISYRPG